MRELQEQMQQEVIQSFALIIDIICRAGVALVIGLLAAVFMPPATSTNMIITIGASTAVLAFVGLAYDVVVDWIQSND